MAASAATSWPADACVDAASVCTAMRACGQRRLSTLMRTRAQVSRWVSASRLNSAGRTHAVVLLPLSDAGVMTAHCSANGASEHAQPMSPYMAALTRTLAMPKRGSTGMGHASATRVQPEAIHSTPTPSVRAEAAADMRTRTVALCPNAHAACCQGHVATAGCDAGRSSARSHR